MVQNDLPFFLLYLFASEFLGRRLIKGHPSKVSRWISIIVLSSCFIVSITLFFHLISNILSGNLPTSIFENYPSILSTFLNFLSENTPFRLYNTAPYVYLLILFWFGSSSLFFTIESISILTVPSLREKEKSDRIEFLKKREAEKKKREDEKKKREEQKLMINKQIKNPIFLKDENEELWIIDECDTWCKRFFLEKNTTSDLNKNIIEQTGKIYSDGAYKITKEVSLTIKEAKSDWKYYLDNDWHPTNKKWD